MNDIILADSAESRNDHTMPICQPSATTTAYTFLRHTGFILDELSAQGLVLWLDNDGRWRWRWQGTDLKSAQGFWAMGEAVVDAVNVAFLKPSLLIRKVKFDEKCYQ